MVRFGRHSRIGRRIRKDWHPLGPGLPILDRATVRLEGSRHLCEHGVWIDVSGKGHHAQLGSVHAAFIGDDFGGVRALHLPGVAGNYASLPDSAGLSITGDISVRVPARFRAAPSAGVGVHLTAKTTGTAVESYWLDWRNDDFLVLFWSEGGTSATRKSAASTIAMSSYLDREVEVRADLDVDNGAGGYTVQFYYSFDGGQSWTQLGVDVVVAGTTSIADTAAPLEIGTFRSGAVGGANEVFVYGAIIYADLIETDKRLDVDFTKQAQGDLNVAADVGGTVTVHQSAADANDPLCFPWVGSNYVLFPGTAGNYLSAADAPVLKILGDIDLRVEDAMDDWTPGATSTLLGKWVAAAGNRSYRLVVTTGGNLRLVISTDGAASTNYTSTVPLGLAAQAIKWVRATLDVDDGAADSEANFYTSDDGVTWTPLGIAVNSGGVVSIFDSTAGIEIGSISVGTGSLWVGKTYRAQIYDGIDGTLVFDYNPQVNFNREQANDAQVTVNRTATAAKCVEVFRTGFLLHTDDLFDIADHPDLNFAAGESFTTVVMFRRYGSPSSFARIFNKHAGGTQAGWGVVAEGTTPDVYGEIGDGTLASNTTSADYAVTPGDMVVHAFRRSVPLDELEVFGQGVGQGGVTDATTASLANSLPCRIGANAAAGSHYSDIEIYAALIFREALSDAEILQLNDELMLTVAEGSAFGAGFAAAEFF